MDFLHDPHVQALLATILGVAVKFVVDRLKAFMVAHPVEGLDKQYRIPVQILVVVFSALAALGNMYLNGTVGELNSQELVKSIVDFVVVTVPIYFSALGTQLFGNRVKQLKDARNAERK